MARIRHSITSRPVSSLYSSAMGARCTAIRIGFRRSKRRRSLGDQRIEHEMQIGVPQRFHVDVIAGRRNHQVVIILKIIARVYLAGRGHRLQIDGEAAARIAGQRHPQIVVGRGDHAGDRLVVLVDQRQVFRLMLAARWRAVSPPRNTASAAERIPGRKPHPAACRLPSAWERNPEAAPRLSASDTYCARSCAASPC